jgi:hypothetical protein
MSFSVNAKHFCGLSTSKDFRTWLRSIAPDLLDRLLTTRKGCKSAQETMMGIHKELYNRSMGPKLEEFMRQRFPYMISKEAAPVVVPQLPKAPIELTPVINHIANLNKHGVFKRYQPNLLTFPHKYIITGERERLEKVVKDFITDKIGVDYIIIDNHAYIEYFPRRYADVAEKVKQEDREIWVYRQKKKQSKV